MNPLQTSKLSRGVVAATLSLSLLAPQLAAATEAVSVQNPWVRATVAGQKGTGGFAALNAKDGAQLVGVRAAVAGVGEVHEMKHDANGVMRMSAMKALDLPAGQTVALKPGGYHLMLMDLKTALPVGTIIPVGLDFVAKDGKRFSQTVSFTVSSRAPSTDAAGHGGSGHKH